MTGTQDSWPAGATWVFQGTVAEDATAGTHVCSLTVTPGAGNEMQLLVGEILPGNTATSQTNQVFILDGAGNELTVFMSQSDTTASLRHGFPTTTGAATNAASVVNGITNAIISGAMQLVLKVTTAAVSVTQTFAVVCRIKGAMPTAVLNDTIGTSTNTVNTNKVF